MAKHRRYSRKGDQRRNRRISRKMKGGIANDDESLNTTISQYSINSLNDSGFSNISSIYGTEDEPGVLFSDIDSVYDDDNSGNTSVASTGGKRRKIKTSKRRTNKRKSKTQKKTRNHRRRRHYGGRGFTTQEETSPLAYIDSREISEANMPRP